ncbi:PREDICTED: E3 ubiquitin-protein ligase Midline-1-like [Branchiostoma belcheri]|uniref:E3 ubiquitin-protein ligase Midline-1-like n=1 Tax=Branchiostoma belcheri TaxID=7741 RepID=A0A6P5AB99_BRABE|nr:PREDICTED: E3 ubiquitin-protein ligase Midline-1-like [Branchiostoma belcheri]
MEGLGDELTCPVCLELYTCPLLLPCQHNLCRRCAEAFLEAPAGEPEGAQAACSSEPAPPSPEDTPGSFACPTCREEVHLGDRGVDGLRRNLLLQNIIDRFKHAQSQLKRDAVPCLVCDAAPPRDAVKSCSTCKLSYCRECLQLLHPSRGVLANHQLVAPMESFDGMQKTVVCPDHKNKPVELYCMEDSTPVCSLCKLVGKHKEHDVAALEEVFESKKEDLQKVVEEMEGKMEKETTKIIELETKKAAIESHGAQVKSQIQTECNALIDIIREREVAMVAKVDEVVKDDTSKIQTFIDNSEKKVKSATSCLAYAKEAVKETDPACFLQSEQLVRGRVEQSTSMFFDDEEHTRIPTDRVSVNLSSAKSLMKGLDLPHAPVISSEKCSATAGEVTVSWDADGQDSDSKTSFDLAYIEWETSDDSGVFELHCSCDDESSDDPAIIVQNIRGNFSVVRGLSSDTKYKFQVCATDDSGGGVCPSASVSMVTLPFFFRFDPETAGKRLHLSERNTRAVKGDAIPSLPEVPGRFKTSTVFGDAAVSGGRHYWEVGTEDARYYLLGVAYGDVSREVNVGESAGGWGIERTSGDTYKAHDEGNSCEINFSPHPDKIGVILDYNAGFVTFQDANSKKVIHTFKVKFERPVYPAFSLWIGLGGISSVLKLHTGVSMPQ